MESNPEIFDVLDKDGLPTGKHCERDEVHRLGLWHGVVHVWVVSLDGCMLFQKRAFNKPNFPGLWDISCAGHIHEGESAVTAACRELVEELSLLRQPSDLKFLYRYQGEDILNHGSYIDREWAHVFLVIANDAEMENMVFDPSEIEDLMWMSPVLFVDFLAQEPEKFVPNSGEYQFIIKHLVES